MLTGELQVRQGLYCQVAVVQALSRQLVRRALFGQVQPLSWLVEASSQMARHTMYCQGIQVRVLSWPVGVRHFRFQVIKVQVLGWQVEAPCLQVRQTLHRQAIQVQAPS